MTSATDAELVGRARSGDRSAYGELVARYQGHVYALAYSLVGDWSSAQDVAQDAFIRAYSNLDRLREPGKFAAWLRRVAFSVAMNWLKAFRPKLFARLGGQVDLDRLEIPDFQPGPPEVAERRELAQAVLHAVDTLPPKYRVPLTMFHMDGLSYQKVADFLDIPLGTAKSLIHRARGKLKSILTDYVEEEITPMVQEAMDERRLPDGFAGKVLESVPVLAWGADKDCTFIGALEAALAVTDHPWSYTDLMGVSGLAFRVRWYQGKQGHVWCGSSAVGEQPDEMEAVQRATGWRLRLVNHLDESPAPDTSQYVPDIMASLDAGLPVLAYPEHYDMALIYAYTDEGRTLLLRDYYSGENVLRIAAEKLGPFLVFVDRHATPQPPREALLGALTMALHNWRRQVLDWGAGVYRYGEACYPAWVSDINQCDELTDDERQNLFSTATWNLAGLVGARLAAESYLKAHADLLDGEGREAVRRAAGHYGALNAYLRETLAKENALPGMWSCGSAENWTPEAREGDRQILARCAELDEAAVSELERALGVV